jgi:hypothetical protein
MGIALFSRDMPTPTVIQGSNSALRGQFVALTTNAPIRPSVAALRRPFFPFTAVLTLIVLGVTFVMSRGRVADPDIWWHLHNAEYLVQHHTLPRYDMYSFTVAAHPWMNHEWLAELPFYFAWKLMGVSGIGAITIILPCVIYLGLLYFAGKESGNFKAATITTICAIFLGRSAFGPRTILFGYAFLVALLIILQRLRQNGRTHLWLIPPMFLLWVNTHGSWSLGMIVFSVVLVGGMFNFRSGLIESEPWTRTQKRNLLWTWAASVVCLFVNPYGARLVFYPLDMAFHQQTNIEHVSEWVSLNFHDVRGKVVLLLLVILLLSILLRPRRWTVAEVALVVFGVYSGLTYVRFLCLMGILLAPMMAKTLDFVPGYRPEFDTPVLNSVVTLLMIAASAHYWPTKSRLDTIVKEQYPAGAVSYLKAHPVNGALLNYYVWGGYIGWSDPATKVFIDGRADIFDYTGVFSDYVDLIGIQRADAILDKYKIRYVLFPHNEPLSNLLQHEPQWRTVYRDENSVLLERDDLSDRVTQ